jgi:hypothetical protein
MGDNSLDVWVAFLAAIFGGAGLKLTESFLSRKQRRDDMLSKTITDRDNEVARERAAKDKAEAEANDWREKYWKLREENANKDNPK